MKSWIGHIAIVFYAIMTLSGCDQSGLVIDKVTVDLAENPVISSAKPRLGWRLLSSENGSKQTAYQITILSEGEVFWNSGKLESDQSQLIPYEGKELNPAEKYEVRVTVWDNNGQIAESKSWFETAPSNESLTAEWIGAIRREGANLPEGRTWHSPSIKKNRVMYDSIPELAKRSIILRKEIEVEKKIKKATAYVSGLGHYELSLNGEKVGNSEFAPLWTDYDKTVFYNTFDLTNELNSGASAIGVLLGNGMYNSIGDRYRKFWVSFGPPTLFFQMEIEYEDGSEETISSDQTWKYDLSPITFNCIFGGEDYNAQIEKDGWTKPGFDDQNWKSVVIQNSPKGTLKPQIGPNIKIQEKFEIQSFTRVDTATYVFDMGQNLAGFPSIRVRGKKGQTVKLVVGERLDEEGRVTQKSTGRDHYYLYTLKGEGEEPWQPRFSYYGYQYIQVEGISYRESIDGVPELLDLKSNYIYSDAQDIGSFECSNEIFTQTHKIIKEAIKSNMQAVFTDCPHREKLGWIEQIHLVGPGLLCNYNLTQSFAKQMMDMSDAQRENGLVPNITPEYTDFSHFSWGADFTDSPEWGAAVVMVPWLYYEYYGDDRLIRTYYEEMKRYVEYLSSRSENLIVSHGLGDWYDYGEHRAGYSKNSPIALSATAHFYHCTKKLAEAADYLAYLNDEETYAHLAREIKKAYNAEFFDQDTGQYGTGSQYSNAVSLYMGLVSSEYEEAVLENIVSDIEVHGDRLTTGDVGNRYLFQVLADNGLNDLMYNMNNHFEAPGYGYQVKYGVTTLTEQWDPEKGNSWNHFMLGQIEEWFFKSLAGIKSDPESPGFKHFYVAPQVVGDLTFVKASTQSLYGTILVDWKIVEGKFKILMEVPVNSTATFNVPDGVSSDEKEIMLSSGRHTLTFDMN